MGKSLSSQTFLMAVRALEAMGQNPSLILKRLQVSQRTLMNPLGRISFATEREFWRLLVDETRDPLIGLRLARHVPYGTFPLLEYIGASCRSLFQALMFFQRYSDVVFGHWSPVVFNVQNRTQFCLGAAGDPEVVQQSTELGLALVFLRLENFSGRRLALEKVTFRHASESSLDIYRDLFAGAEVLFLQDEDSLLFKDDLQRIPCQNSQNVLLSSLLTVAEQVLQRLPSRKSRDTSVLILQLRKVIGSQLQDGDPSAGSVAKVLGMSVRTLQRRLDEEGVSFTECVTEVRRAFVVELLENPNLTQEDVAHQLGYSTLSAFHRAFKSWYQMAPSEFRQGLLVSKRGK